MSSVRFKSGLNVDVVNASQLFMLSDSDQVLMDNQAVAQVAKAIDGHRDMVDIVAAASRHVGPAMAFAAVRSMLEKGYIREDALKGGAFGAYLESRGLDPSRTINELATRQVKLLPLVLQRPRDEVQRTMEQIVSGLDVLDQRIAVECLTEDADTTALGPASLLVVVAEDYVHPRLEDLNKAPWK